MKLTLPILLAVSGVGLLAVSLAASATGKENWWWTTGTGVIGGLLVIGAIGSQLIGQTKALVVV